MKSARYPRVNSGPTDFLPGGSAGHDAEAASDGDGHVHQRGPSAESGPAAEGRRRDHDERGAGGSRRHGSGGLSAGPAAPLPPSLDERPAGRPAAEDACAWVGQDRRRDC